MSLSACDAVISIYVCYYRLVSFWERVGPLGKQGQQLVRGWSQPTLKT